MAILGFHVDHKTERSGGAASRAMAYLTRTGEYAPPEIAYLTRTSADTVERGDYIDKTHGNLPAWAQGDAGQFFAQAEALERGGAKRGGRWATTWQMALPHELTRAQQWEMGTAFVAMHLQRHAYVCVMHDPVKDGQHQPHLHVMFSERTDHGGTPDAATYFRRPEVGGCAKDRWFNHRGTAYALREAWADWTNYTLERFGHTERVHPGSLYARDIDRKPEPKVGYSSDPERHAERERIRAQRDVEKEQAKASAGWEARKQRLELGPIHERLPREFLRETYSRARQQEAGVWNPALARRRSERIAAWKQRRYDQRREQERTLAHSIHRLGAYQERLREARTQELHYSARGMPLPVARQLQSERVLAEARAHGLPPDMAAERVMRSLPGGRPRFHEELVLPDVQEERSSGRAARVRLWEKRHEREEREER